MKRPLAYITAAWSGQRIKDVKLAARYEASSVGAAVYEEQRGAAAKKIFGGL